MVAAACVCVLVSVSALLISLHAESKASRLLDADEFVKRLEEVEGRQDNLRDSFLKILKPVRSNAEDIAILDDELERIEMILRELRAKKREESPPVAQPK